MSRRPTPRPWIALVALVAIGCFERGPRDRGPPPGASAASPASDRGWRAGDPAGAADPHATIRIALEAEPATLDPFATLDAASSRVLGQVVEGLVCVTGAGAVEPCVASRWTVDDDGHRLRFQLDPARRFSDGRAVTAADVVASLEASRGVGHAAGPLAGVLDDATAIAATADGVEVRTRERRSERLRDLALIPIVPATQLAAPSLASAPIGTGPFAIASWDRGDRIALARVDGAARPAAAARLEFAVVADRADAIRRLAAGQLEVVVQVPIADAIAATEAQPRLTRFRYQQPAYLAAIYNCRRPALADPDARRRLTATLDRAGIARAVLGGAPLLTGPWLPDDPSSDPTVVAPGFVGPGVGTGGVPLTVAVPAGSTSTARIADIWAADARGRFALQVVAVPFADLLARLAAGDFDVAITSLSAGPEVDPASRLASDAPPDQAWSGLRDRALDELFAARRQAATEAERATLGRAIHRRVAELAPMAFIAVDTRAGLAAADVGGVTAGPGLPRGWQLWRARR